MIFCKQRFFQSAQLFFPVVKKASPYVIPLGILFYCLEYGVSTVHHMRFESPYTTSTLLVIATGIAAFVFECLFSVLWILSIASSTVLSLNPDKNPTPSHSPIRHLHQVIIEYVRSIVSIGLYSLLLILPGIYRWVRLTFVCWIGFLNPNYHQGKIDALDHSQKISKGFTFPLLILMVLTSSLPPFLEKMGSDLNNLGGITFFYIAGWATSLFFCVYLTLTFLALEKRLSTAP